MLKLYQSRELKRLAQQLLNETVGQPKKQPLQPDLIILQNKGMKRWLQHYTARQTGVAANMNMMLPGEFVWDVYRQMDHNLPETLPSEREPMQFLIFSLLQSGEKPNDLSPLYKYVETEVEGGKAERTWHLSAHIADLFDRYQLYRPELILNWQRGKCIIGSEAEKWQTVLWQLLNERWKNQFPDAKWRNRAELHKAFLKQVKQNKLSKNILQHEINIFGVAEMAPIFLETFTQLSKETDVNYYRHNITQKGGEAHGLADSLGRADIHFSSMFESYASDSGIDYKKSSITPHQSSGNSLLTHLQDDIFAGNERNDDHELAQSIQVHSCHSAMREVEVLYDQLLAAFDFDPTLNPDDVLIVTPDIEGYAPLIYSVFGSPDEGQPDIPFYVDGAGSSSGQAVIQAFLNLLDLLNSRFKVTEVLDLLFSAPVCEAFGISEQDTDRLERWVSDNNIRWGIDRMFKEAMELPDSNHFTWNSGLNRLLLGSVMQPDDTRLFNEIFPYADIADSEDAVLIGKFSHFLKELFGLYNQVQVGKPLEKWMVLLKQTVNTFFADSIAFKDEKHALLSIIDKLNNWNTYTEKQTDIPFNVIHLWMKNELESQSKISGGSGRGVTFSSMIATRSIPFKMVGMIGMNDDAFPRKDRLVGFDLMKKNPKAGDPNRLEEDRYLFLELLMSAEAICYFSYVGQSNRGDAEFPPSVLVTELLDYLQKQYGIEAASLLVKHPLQNYSAEYFKRDKLFSYSATRNKIAQQVFSNRADSNSWLGMSLPALDGDEKVISLNELISFYQHPVKSILKNRLDVFLKDEAQMMEDREPFKLRGLNKYNIKQNLLKLYLDEKNPEKYQKVFRSQDRLPEGWTGEEAFEQKVREAKLFGNKVLEKTAGRQPEPVEIDLDVDGYNLQGNIAGFYDPLFIHYRFGKRKAKYLIDWWIKHVALSACNQTDPEVESVFLTWNKEKLEEDHLVPIMESQAILKNLMQGYRKGIQQIPYFFPASSFAYAKSLYKNNDEEKASDKAKKEWEPSYNGWPGEGDDPYIKLAVSDDDPVKAINFKKAALHFWDPFFTVYNQERN